MSINATKFLVSLPSILGVFNLFACVVKTHQEIGVTVGDFYFIDNLCFIIFLVNYFCT